MILIEIGNVAPLASSGTRTTSVHFDPSKISDVPGHEYDELIADLTDPRDGLWQYHSGRPPAWVHATDPDVEAALRAHFGIGAKPKTWVETDGPADDHRHGINDPRAEGEVTA